MKILYLTSVAIAALAVGLASAQAQGMNPRNDERPAADSRQQPQRAKETDRSRRAPSSKSWDQQAAEKAEQDRQSGTTGTSQGQAERPSADRSSAPQQRATESDRNRSNASPRSNANREDSRNERRSRAGRNQDRSTSESATQDGNRATGPATQRSTTGTSTSSEATRSTQQQGQTAQDSSQRSLALSEQQRTRITATFSNRIDRMNVRPLSRSSISVSIGATIPPSVRVYAVPADIVRIYPRFRGHHFVVVEDEIVIIAPDRRRIIATLPMSGTRQATRSTTRSTTGSAPARDRIRLSPQEQTVIRTTVLREPACRLEQRLDFFIGIPLPRTVRVCEFPDEVLAEVPEVRRYRYITRGDEVVVVDPDGYEVVDVIR
jgi:hypothetical protein